MNKAEEMIKKAKADIEKRRKEAEEEHGMDRRGFIKRMAAIGAGGALIKTQFEKDLEEIERIANAQDEPKNKTIKPEKPEPTEREFQTGKIEDAGCVDGATMATSSVLPICPATSVTYCLPIHIRDRSKRK